MNRVPVLIGWGKGGYVTSARWQVTLCDPTWHVSYRSIQRGVCELLYAFTLLYHVAGSGRLRAAFRPNAGRRR